MSTMSTNETSYPPCRILFRSKKAVELYRVDEKPSPSSSDEPKCVTLAKGMSTIHSFSPSGSKLVVHLPSTGVQLFVISQSVSEQGNASITLANTKGVQFMCFSTQGSYILTWERASKPEEGETNPPPNLKIWSSTTGEFLYGFSMKNCRRSQWPPVKWTHDEKIAFHLVTNEIHVYDGTVFTQQQEVKYIDKVRCKGVTSFSLSVTFTPTLFSVEGKYLLSTFVQETKGQPARVSLLRYPDKCGDGENPTSGPVLVSKSFYQAEECLVQWSPKGDAALVLTTTSIDTSGASYYGSTNLYLLLSENRSGLNGEALSVPLPSVSKADSGPVLDVAWMPNASKPAAFAVVSGKMPAMASLHNGTTADPTFLFGNSHRNTIVWGQHGRFLTLGGFGNLAGGMDFYDRNKLKKIPQFDPSSGVDLGANGNTASCAVGHGWSPSSRYFMVSTTTPRMNVDNGVRLYKYNGLEIRDPNIVSWDNSKYCPDQLLAAEFVPASTGEFPDRAQSPPPKPREGDAGDAHLVSAAAAAAPAAYVPPIGRYVPPGAKRGSGMSLAERMRKEREGSTTGATKLFPKAFAASLEKKLPVGMAPANDGKSKNALRKERQKVAKEKQEQEEAEEKQRQEKEEKARLESAANDPVKKAKKLNKILKQISELKKKDPSSLNEDQKNKIASEAELVKNLAELNIS